MTWPGKVARISNHVYFHDKSALRQAIRNAGIHKFIGKYDISSELSKLSKETRQAIMKEKDRLENTFRCYSLHCGGIVYYPEGIPDELLLESKRNINPNPNRGALKQISMNKYDVAKDKNFKIDILSSRALSQCYEINKYKSIPFEEFVYDKQTFDMLHRGDNIGIILGESPLMRKAFMKIKPRCLHDLAICLAIIRPAAKDARKDSDNDELDMNIIFDDDAIELIGKYINIDDEKADNYRRAFAKGDKKVMKEFKNCLEQHLYSKEKQKEIMKKLSNLSRYGFCKSHAYSYAQLIWKLAYMKSHYPAEFWKAVLNNCHSSYKKWVHLYEAKLVGVDYSKQLLKKDDISIYANNRRKKIETYTLREQLKKYGYWVMTNKDFFPGCYFIIENDICKFNGIIASYKLKKNKKNKLIMLFIGVMPKKYIQVDIENVKYFEFNDSKIGVDGVGKYLSQENKNFSIITSTSYTFY